MMIGSPSPCWWNYQPSFISYLFKKDGDKKFAIEIKRRKKLFKQALEEYKECRKKELKEVKKIRKQILYERKIK